MFDNLQYPKNRDTSLTHGTVTEAGSFTIPAKSISWGFKVTGGTADVNGQTFPDGHSEVHSQMSYNYPAIVINNVGAGATVYYWYVTKL